MEVHSFSRSLSLSLSPSSRFGGWNSPPVHEGPASSQSVLGRFPSSTLALRFKYCIAGSSEAHDSLRKGGSFISNFPEARLHIRKETISCGLDMHQAARVALQTQDLRVETLGNNQAKSDNGSMAMRVVLLDPAKPTQPLPFNFGRGQ